MKLSKRLLESFDCSKVDDPFPSFCFTFLLDDEGGDVVFEAAGAADPALVVAGLTGYVIEDRPKAIAAIGEGISYFPVMDEQNVTCPSHVVIDFRMARRAPSQHAESGRQ